MEQVEQVAEQVMEQLMETVAAGVAEVPTRCCVFRASPDTCEFAGDNGDSRLEFITQPPHVSARAIAAGTTGCVRAFAQRSSGSRSGSYGFHTIRDPGGTATGRGSRMALS